MPTGRGGSTQGRGGGRSGGGSRSSHNPHVHANKAATSTNTTAPKGWQSHAPPKTSEAAGISGITPTQWQQILDALNNLNTNDRLHGKNDNAWIIDTGASNHVIGNLKCMINVKKISHCPVEPSNGKDAIATRQGSVILNGGLRLDNVLFVPQLTCNLIFVTQLFDDTNCIVQITNALCVIQDRTTRKLIGAGERADGLYFF